MIQPHHITQAVERTQQALIIAEHKPSPKGQGGGSNTVEAPLPLPVGLISAKRELADWLTDWCSLVRDGLEVVATYDLDEHSRLEWLGSGERAEFLAGHETAQDFLDEITAITRQLESPYLPRAGKKYLGNHEGVPLYAREGQRTVELPNGDTIPVIEVKDAAADRLLDYEGTAEQVALIIRKYFGHEELTARQITAAQRDDKRKKEGNKLEPVRTEGRNHIYAVFDVLKRLCQK